MKVRVFENPDGVVAHVIRGIGHYGPGSLMAFCLYPIRCTRGSARWFIEYDHGQTEVALMDLADSGRPVCKQCAGRLRKALSEVDAHEEALRNEAD